MSNISYIITNDGTIAASVDNKPLPPIGKDHPNYEAAKAALKAGDGEKLKQLADIPKGVKQFTAGKVEVRDGVVFYEGEALHNAITDRILLLMREGFDFAPMVKFLENLLLNPASSAVRELYDFLAHRALPITEDGHFLAYKRVRDDWTDVYSGKFDNHVGKVVEMARNKVDDTRANGCSYGLHVGTIEYVRDYSGAGCENGGHILIVKVNPKDVVSVPTECNCTKLRTCRYEVVDEYKGDLTAALYKPNATPATPSPVPGPGVATDHNSLYDSDEEFEDEYDDDDDDDDLDDDEFEDDDDEDEDDDDDLDDDEPSDPVPPAPPIVQTPQPADTQESQVTETGLQTGFGATGPNPSNN
jgi:hypothetical protein